MKSDATSGCKFEKDLKGLVAKIDALDERVLEQEENYRGGEKYTSQEMEDVRKDILDMTALLKEANTKSQALQQMLKVSTNGI